MHNLNFPLSMLIISSRQVDKQSKTIFFLLAYGPKPFLKTTYILEARVGRNPGNQTEKKHSHYQKPCQSNREKALPIQLNFLLMSWVGLGQTNSNDHIKTKTLFF
eukprot:TRINITY_DN5890_c0_g1_i3.p1 TRINITY_DN5890_c0_g1~~TRINITY_DN5890_c0_g1_i3.p1  ORF type:complete len:105 (+),score=10.38 TRINITY_DN5890_c0_g1_i3:518-832(+)